MYKSKRRIDNIIVHSSATKVTSNFTVEQLRHEHVVVNKWADIGYHFYITKDGVVHECRPLNIAGAHCQGFNSNSIGVCYEGGLDAKGKPDDTRTPKQKHAMLVLLKELKASFPNAKIAGHRDFSPDKNKNGKIEPWEWIKQCPCFDAVNEYLYI